MHRVLVTGGSGFIGTNLLHALAHSGAAVANLDIAPPRDPGSRSWWTPVDVTDGRALLAAARQFAPTHLVHLAARTDLDERAGLAGYSANTDGVRHVVDAVSALPDLERVVFASTSLVFTPGVDPRHEWDYRPTTVYGTSKVIGEEIVRAADPRVTWCLVRPTSIWGPWFGAPYRDFFRAIAAGRYVHPAGRHPRKSYGYVENSVHQLLTMLAAPPDAVHRRPFWLADYPEQDLAAWADSIADAFGVRRPRRVPYAALKAAARAGDLVELTGARAPLTSFRLHNIVGDAAYDTNELRRLCGALPVAQADAVRRTVAWMRADAGTSAATA